MSLKFASLTALALTLQLSACSSARRSPAANPESARINIARNLPSQPGIKNDWQLVERPDLNGIRYWQVIAPDSVERMNPEDRQAAIDGRRAMWDDSEVHAGAVIEGCPVGMVRVKGQQKDWRGIRDLQRNPKACLRFDNAKWDPIVDKCYVFDEKLVDAKDVPSSPKDFCIDRFEFPNIPGENPAVAVSWTEAHTACESQGKRLCGEEEWSFACEGEKALPFPYGFVRDSTACNLDHENKHARTPVNPSKIGTTTELIETRESLDELWGGAPSGSYSRCRSPFGVYDMTGNADEWVDHSDGHEWEMAPGNKTHIPSIMKGGWWGPIRGRCLPATTSHGPLFKIYEGGFRCCANAAAK